MVIGLGCAANSYGIIQRGQSDARLEEEVTTLITKVELKVVVMTAIVKGCT
jgi:hypothetical protein